MKNEPPAASTRLYSPCATLCATGVKLRALKFFDTLAEHVHIKQKAIRHTPVEKLTDAFIAILAGAHGLCVVNTRVRSEAALRRASGRSSCAEQPVVQETLDACTVENVRQMEHARKALMRSRGRAYRHPYRTEFQLLDVDLTGLPCGHRAEKASKGYCANRPGRYGRRMARVIATHYEEVVLDRVGPGNVQLDGCLRPLVEETEWMLDLDAAKRARTVLRIDAGGGSINDVNRLLSRGYQIHSKAVSAGRAAGVAPTVREWYDDPPHPGRRIGRATCPSDGYERGVRRLIVRWRKPALLSTLTPRQVFGLLGESPKPLNERRAVALASADLYDKRGGAIESEIKEDKQGFGLARRNKKRYYAQQMVVLLSALAHDVVVWSRGWLSGASQVRRQGVPRMVRDVYHVCGFVEVGAKSVIRRIVLNGAAAWARRCANPLRALLKPEHVRVSLGET